MPNSNFEIYTLCPQYLGEIKKVQGWDSVRLTPDYFNVCATYTTGVSIPFNAFGYQNDFAGGAAYAGLWAYNRGMPNDGREYIQTKLTDTLKPYHKYVATMHVSLGNYSAYAIASMGMYFTMNPVGGPPILGFIQVSNPQVKGKAPLIDTLNWMAVQDTFVAQGGEAYLTIGNFSYDSLSDTLRIRGGNMCYYYIDSVTVFDTGLTGVPEKRNEETMANIFPNPNNGDFEISFALKEDAALEICDLHGRSLLKTKLSASANSMRLYCEGLENGVYLYKVVSDKFESQLKKLVIVK